MRYVLIASFALVVGLVMGGVQPRVEVRRLEKTVEQQDRECRPMLGSEIVRAIQREPTPTPGEPPPPEADQPQQEEREGEEEDLAEGRTILAARRAQARAALIEGANPTPEQLDEFDAAVADMNAEMRELGEELLARVRELGETPPRAELYLYAADGLGVVIETEKRIREALGEQAGHVDAESIDPLSHVDPGLVDLLVELDQAGLDP
jgi:hypothetical protein